MVSAGLAASELPRHTNHGTQTREREGKTSVLLRQVGLIDDTPDERADAEHILGFPTRSVKFNGRLIWCPRFDGFRGQSRAQESCGLAG